MADNDGLRKRGEIIVKSILPDFCKTPPSMAPVPYDIIGRFNDSVAYTESVRFTCEFTVTSASRLPKVYGDEAGTGGGILSGVNQGPCWAITYSSTVRAEKNNVTYHTSLYWMNCNGPEGPGNTIGAAVFVEDVSCVHIGALGTIMGDTNPPIHLEASVDKGFWHHVGGFFEGAGEGALDMATGIAHLGKSAVYLSNPFMGAIDPDGMKEAVNTAEGLGKLAFATSPLGMIIDPEGSTETIKRVGKAFIEPYQKAWSEGEYGKAFGRGTFDIVALIGTDGLGEGAEALGVTGRAGEAMSAVGKGEEALSALSKGEEVATTLSKGEEAANAVSKGEKGAKASEGLATETKVEESLARDGIEVSSADFYWGGNPFKRGRLIEDHLAKTEYADWLQTDNLAGFEKARNYPVIDFVKGDEVVSLKTADTALSSWPSNLKGDIRKLSSFNVPSDLVSGVPEKILDLRVQPGGIEAGGKALQDLVEYGNDRGVEVIINEFP